MIVRLDIVVVARLVRPDIFKVLAAIVEADSVVAERAVAVVVASVLVPLTIKLLLTVKLPLIVLDPTAERKEVFSTQAVPFQ